MEFLATTTLTKRKVSATVNDKEIHITEELFSEALGLPNTGLDFKTNLTAAESNAVRLVISADDQDPVIHSSRKNKLKPEFKWLLNIISRSIQGRGGEPLPPNNILNSEQMSEKTDKAVKPKSSRTKSLKGTDSSAPAEEDSKQEKPKRKAVQAEASQKKKGRKKSSAKKSSNNPTNSEKTLSSDNSPKRTGDVFQPIPINTVIPINVDSPPLRQTEPSGSHETESASKEEVEVSIHSKHSKSPNKNIDEVMANVGLNTSKVIVDVVQNIAKETEDDVSSHLKPANQVEISGQSESHSVEEKEPSGSAGNKSVPIDTTIQSAQDGPADSTIVPEGPVQVNKGKEVLFEDSAVKGKGVLQTGSQPETLTEAEVVISAEEEEEMFKGLIRDMDKDEKLLELEELALKLANTNVIQAAFSKTAVIHEYARLHAVEDALREAEGATLTPIEAKMFERFHLVREKLLKSVERLDAKWRNECRHHLTHAKLYQSQPFFAAGETSMTAENRGSDPPQNDKALELEQVKQVVIDTLKSCLGNYSIATDEKIATVETNLTNAIRGSVQNEMANTAQTSIRSMIDEAVQTSVKSLIAESVQTTTSPLVDMLQAMAVQIGELSKLQVSKTQEQFNSDAETAKKLQDEERERERLRKELEDKDHALAKQCEEEEQADLHEPIPAQISHAMKTRNKNKRKAVAEVMKREEQNSQRVIEPVGLNVQPLDEEEEEDIEELNRRKKKAIGSSTATPRPIIAQTSRPPKPVCAGFGFGKRTPDISSVFAGWRIDAERRDREWKAREEEERRRKEKELEKGGPSKP
ncbi:DNA ligase 1-like [Impatiens glandulifera]|uniref:DNA ligase 1-like n=1 Tax=Impatiens glandulifera TaxID=253017 RepID=UPI001FB10A0D|nr:DNA ligase 1-like [Impatiens glandulifera]